MDEVEQLSGLIGEIYDAALDPSLWNRLLPKTVDFVGGSGAGLFRKDVLSKSGMAYYGSGIDPYYTKIYFEKYVRYDPSSMGHFFAAVEQPISTVDLMAIDEFYRSRFYLEWAKPQGLVDFISASLDKSPASIAMFGVFRNESQGMATPDTYRRMRLIVPHIRRSVLIGRFIDLKTGEAESFADVLDGLAVSIFLVGETGRIMHSNGAGLALVRKGDPLVNVNGYLATREQKLTEQFKQLFQACASGDVALGVQGISFPLEDRGGTRMAAHILPLTVGKRRNAHKSYQAVAAVFVREASIDPISPPELVAKAFNLTPTELRVFLAIVEVGGVPEVAHAIGIAESTVKTHLNRLFEKTGTSRQADLVKVFVSYASPLCN